MCSFIFGNTTFISCAAATKVYLAFVFCFLFLLLFCFVVVVVVVFVFCCCCCYCFFFAREDKNVASLACLATQVYFPHSPPSLFLFFLSEKMKTRCIRRLPHRLSATQALSPHRLYHHTGFITTQDYFLTGLFCHSCGIA